MKFKKEEHGLVHIYTGNGKGKTTAALGLALRSISYRKKVLIIQFIKGPWRSGELNLTKALRPYLTIKAMGQGFVKILGDQKPFKVHQHAAQEAFQFARQAVRSGKYDLVILDEINVALHERLLSTRQVVELIKRKPVALELVLTGRYAPGTIVRLADYVSEIRMVRHPFNRGILARPSIDY